MGVDVLVTYDADFADLLFGDECEQVERIVRCKDCKHCEMADWTNYILYEYRGREIKHLCHEFADYEGTPMVVEPNGFCAWGEAR